LTNTGPIVNNGVIHIPAVLQLRLLGGNLTNAGIIDLAGGAVSGTASLINSAAGTVRGNGSITTAMTNDGGVIHATGTGLLLISNLSGGNIHGGELRIDDGSTLNVAGNFSSDGTIVLSGPNALLNGGATTNTGLIRGAGRVSNRVFNS